MKEEFHLIDQLEIDQFLSRDEWIFLIEHRSDALERYLFEKSEAVRIREYGHDIYIRGLIEFTNYCHNDCYTAVSGKAIQTFCVTACLRLRFFPAATSVMNWGFAPLYFRVVKITGLQQNGWQRLLQRFTRIFLIVLLHCPSVNVHGKAIRLCSMRVLTVICSVMKHMTLSITAGFILIRFLPFTDGNAFGI